MYQPHHHSQSTSTSLVNELHQHITVCLSVSSRHTLQAVLTFAVTSTASKIPPRLSRSVGKTGNAALTFDMLELQADMVRQMYRVQQLMLPLRMTAARLSVSRTWVRGESQKYHTQSSDTPVTCGCK